MLHELSRVQTATLTNTKNNIGFKYKDSLTLQNIQTLLPCIKTAILNLSKMNFLDNLEVITFLRYDPDPQV